MKPLLDPALEAYAHEHTRARPPLFDELREETLRSMANPQMQVGRVEGALLKLLVGLSGARRVLEIGTFTGYSGLCMAEALPDDGELLTCDVDPLATGLARRYFDRSPHGRKITIRLAPALDTLRELAASAPFDLVFIDADKQNYVAYYEASLPLLRRGGLLVADNMLWSGRVLAPASVDDHAIVALNARIVADERVDNVLLTVRDGIMLARKR